MKGRSAPPALIAGVLLVLAASLPFLPALRCGFTFDDRGVIVENPAVWAPSASPAWTTPYWPSHAGSGLYRPWTTFSYWWNGRLTGHAATGFHVVNLLLHALATVALYAVLRRLFAARGRLAWLAALLFAVHPLHAEAVVSVVGRAELWAAALGLLSWLLVLSWERRRSVLALVGAGVAFLLACLSKESAAGLLLLPFLHLVLDRWHGAPGDGSSPKTRRWLTAAAAWTAALTVVIVLRAQVLGRAVGLSGVTLADNALAHEPAPTRMLHALGIQWLLVWRTLLPTSLAADASYPQIVPGAGLALAGVLFLALFSGLCRFVWRRRDREMAWGIGILLAAGFVTSNVPLAVGTIYGERLAYLPSAGSIWLLAVAGHRLARRPSVRRLAVGVALCWGLFLAGRSWIRALDWRDDLTLFRATTSVSPRSAKAWTNLAVACLERDRVGDALQASGRAVELYPGYPAALEARGTALTRSGRAAEAVAILRPALHDPKPRPRSLIELGNAWLSLGNGAAAESAFVAAGRVLPASDPADEIGLASAFALQHRWRESASTWSRAVARKPDDPSVRRSYAWSLWQAGAVDSAVAVYRGIVAGYPRDASSRNDFAWLLARTRRNPRDAVTLSREAFALQPDAGTADTYLVSLLAADGPAAAGAWLDSLERAAPAFLTPEAGRSLRERWATGPVSGTLDDR